MTALAHEANLSNAQWRKMLTNSDLGALNAHGQNFLDIYFSSQNKKDRPGVEYLKFLAGEISVANRELLTAMYLKSNKNCGYACGPQVWNEFLVYMERLNYKNSLPANQIKHNKKI